MSKEVFSEDDLREMFTYILEKLIHEKNFQLPIHFALIAANGYILTGVHKTSADPENIETELFNEHAVELGVMFPVNLLFVDSKAEARLVFMKAPIMSATIH